jgi:DNA-binding transcriptional LysR family regulator
VLSALRDTDPGADISVTDIVSGEAIELVVTGALDVAIFATRNEALTQPPEVIVEHVMTDPMYIVLPEGHPLTRDADVPLTLDKLRDEKWVLLGASHAAREQFNQAASDAGFTPHIQCETESHDVAQALVASGIGVAMVSHLALNSTPGTMALPLAQPKVARQILVATPRDRSLSPLTNSLVRHLLDVSQSIERGWES